MNPLDRVLLLTFATLLLAVVFIERSKFAGAPQHVKPPAPGKYLLERTNVPDHRDHTAVVDDVAYEDVTDAAGNEPQASST